MSEARVFSHVSYKGNSEDPDSAFPAEDAIMDGLGAALKAGVYRVIIHVTVVEDVET